LGGEIELKKFIKNNEIKVLLNPILETKPVEQYSWTYQILKACIDLPNVYVDTSFSCYKPEYHLLIKVLLNHNILSNKIIYGTDFHLNKTVAGMKNYIDDFIKVIGKQNFLKIAEENSDKFFKIK